VADRVGANLSERTLKWVKATVAVVVKRAVVVVVRRVVVVAAGRAVAIRQTRRALPATRRAVAEGTTHPAAARASE
jgi:hypothetical protein